MTFVCRV